MAGATGRLRDLAQRSKKNIPVRSAAQLTASAIATGSKSDGMTRRKEASVWRRRPDR
jgi:hypothetical protein